MMQTERSTGSAEILSILAECERAAPYVADVRPAAGDSPPRTVPLEYGTDAEIVCISDLHISSGMMADGNYSGTENFFSDESFARFLASIARDIAERGHRGVLIINGDLVDFMRVVRVPASRDEFNAWQGILFAIGVNNHRTAQPFTADELALSVQKKEVKFGLKTNDYKSVWKLASAVNGHPGVFAALARWIERGNEVVITKGNHDLEWLWKPVRDYFRLVMAETVNPEAPAVPLREAAGRIRFIDDALIVNGRIYIEHGHRYDRWTRVIGTPTLQHCGDAELNIPLGSFVNRYLLNMLEELYPFMDNIRPLKNFIPMLIRENLPLGLKAVRQGLSAALYLVPKGYFGYVFARIFPFVLGVAVPLLVLGIVAYDQVSTMANNIQQYLAHIPFYDLLSTTIAMPVLGYFWMKAIAHWQIDEPSSLFESAYGLAMAHPAYDVVIMGHTHNPEQSDCVRADGTVFRFYNTGTWIPVIETSSADIRADKTYTYLHFFADPAPAAGAAFLPAGLRRWNDDAARSEELSLIVKRPGWRNPDGSYNHESP